MTAAFIFSGQFFLAHKTFCNLALFAYILQVQSNKTATLDNKTFSFQFKVESFSFIV